MVRPHSSRGNLFPQMLAANQSRFHSLLWGIQIVIFGVINVSKELGMHAASALRAISVFCSAGRGPAGVCPPPGPQRPARGRRPTAWWTRSPRPSPQGHSPQTPQLPPQAADAALPQGFPHARSRGPQGGGSGAGQLLSFPHRPRVQPRVRRCAVTALEGGKGSTYPGHGRCATHPEASAHPCGDPVRQVFSEAWFRHLRRATERGLQWLGIEPGRSRWPPRGRGARRALPAGRSLEGRCAADSAPGGRGLPSGRGLPPEEGPQGPLV